MSNVAIRRPPVGLDLLRRVDLVLIASTALVAAVGVVMVYSATRSNQELVGNHPRHYLELQAVYVVIGFAVMAGLALLDYRRLERAAGVLYVGSILALLSMFAIGTSAKGATRWIPLGPVRVQPSAFAMLVMVVTVATFCGRRPNGLRAGELVKVLMIAAVPIVLVARQPDLGTAIVMSVVLLVMLIVAGIPSRYLVLLLAGAVLAVYLVLHFHLLQSYQQQRLTGFVNQTGTKTQTTYTYAQSEAAIGAGGMWGSGLFHGAQTNLNYVPEQQTDFIFSAVGEQLGFVGAAAVLTILGVVVWRVLRAAQLARDPFGRLLATGVFTLLAFSVFENAGMTMGIMPIAGIELPFLSYGGSATVAFFLAVGLALSVHLRHTLR